MTDIVNAFCMEGLPVRCEPYGEGHINRSYLVVTDTSRRYILQRISRAAFHDVPGLMENILAVTEYLAAKAKDPRTCLRLNRTGTGGCCYVDETGEYWRLYDFIEGGLCLQQAETPEDFYRSGVAFGSFQNMLREFPAHTLHETIPDFHNTPVRYRQFDAARKEDRMGRAAKASAVRDRPGYGDARAFSL